MSQSMAPPRRRRKNGRLSVGRGEPPQGSGRDPLWRFSRGVCKSKGPA